MVTAVWRKGEGWGDGKVEAYGPIQLMPSAAVHTQLEYSSGWRMSLTIGDLRRAHHEATGSCSVRHGNARWLEPAEAAVG